MTVTRSPNLAMLDFRMLTVDRFELHTWNIFSLFCHFKLQDSKSEKIFFFVFHFHFYGGQQNSKWLESNFPVLQLTGKFWQHLLNFSFISVMCLI
jgi:hypothetical protein